MTLPGLIDEYAHEYRVTRRELAHALGMSERTFARKMARPDAFTLGQVRRVAGLLNIPADELRGTI